MHLEKSYQNTSSIFYEKKKGKKEKWNERRKKKQAKCDGTLVFIEFCKAYDT